MAGPLQKNIRAIEESEKRYRLLFETAADAIFILEAEGDQVGRILQANQAAAAMHGYSVEELKNMRIQDLNDPVPAALPRVERILKRDEWMKFEVNHRRKDGTIFPVEVSARLLETAGHNYILAMDRDLTERKQAEKELKRTERIRIAGELATGLAHEIKNPLASIMVFMERLSEESYLPEEDRDAVKKVIGEIERIEFLMQGLLNFARPPKPQLPVHGRECRSRNGHDPRTERMPGAGRGPRYSPVARTGKSSSGNHGGSHATETDFHEPDPELSGCHAGRRDHYGQNVLLTWKPIPCS